MAGSMMQSAAILWDFPVPIEPSRRGLALGMVGLVRVVPIVSFLADRRICRINRAAMAKKCTRSCQSGTS